MNFIVIEGLDGSGKSTQIKYLKESLKIKQIPYHYLHFPRTESPVFGMLISRFLRGEFGTIDEVNPYLVSLIYAGDRMDATREINENLKKEKLVIADRYVMSNIAYQCAKISDSHEQTKLHDWILHLEYEYYKIPKPVISIFLDVPFQFIRNNLTGIRQGADRGYLNGTNDIHERDLDFQQKVRQNYLKEASTDPSLKIIDCSNSKGNMLSPESIFEKISSLLITKKILNLPTI